MSANKFVNRLATIIVLLLSTIPVIAQEQTTGFPRFASVESSGFDSINRQYLNNHFEIPIASFPGRGIPFNYALVYDSLIWTKLNGAWTPVVNSLGTPTWGWKLDTPYGQSKYTKVTENCDTQPPLQPSSHYLNYRYQDAAGTVHYFDIDFYTTATVCGFPTGPRTGYANDGSGIYMDATNAPAPKVTLPQGFIVTLTKDSNGNYLTLGANGAWTDSRGKTVVQVTSGTGTKTYAVLDKNGTYQNTTVNLQTFNIKTNFLCTGTLDYTGTASLPVSVSQPNGQSYSFTYEATPGYSGYTTGRLLRVTLPTGGYYEYVYPTTSNNGTSCTDGTPIVMTRNISDGSSVAQWDFSRSGTVTTITKPQLPYDSARNQSTYDFAAVRVEKHYQGAAATGTLLSTLNTNFSGPIVSTLILPDGSQSKTETTLGPGDQVAQQTEYAFGSGAPGAAIRTTVNTFVTDTNYTNTSRNIGTRSNSTPQIIATGTSTGMDLEGPRPP